MLDTHSHGKNWIISQQARNWIKIQLHFHLIYSETIDFRLGKYFIIVMYWTKHVAYIHFVFKVHWLLFYVYVMVMAIMFPLIHKYSSASSSFAYHWVECKKILVVQAANRGFLSIFSCLKCLVGWRLLPS